MMRGKQYLEAIFATVTSGAAITADWLGVVNALLGIMVTLASLAWWVRLWIKKPELKPPTRAELEIESATDEKK